MTSHRADRLRVAAPTLEPDPVLLATLAEVGASSHPAAPRTARPAGLRLIVATAGVAAIATATWAAGIPAGTDIPLSPVDAPTQEETSGPPSPGNVGSPQTDVSDLPGSPASPGLPGNTPSPSQRPGDPSGHGHDKAEDKRSKDKDKKDKDRSGPKDKDRSEGKDKRTNGDRAEDRQGRGQGKGQGAENRSDNGRRGSSGAMPPSSQGQPQNPQR